MQQRAECDRVKIQAQSREKTQQEEVQVLRKRVGEAVKGIAELQKQLTTLHGELENKVSSKYCNMPDPLACGTIACNLTLSFDGLWWCRKKSGRT
jgi:hypothetical protein